MLHEREDMTKRQIRLVVLVTEAEHNALNKVAALTQDTMGPMLRRLIKDGLRYRGHDRHYPERYEDVMWEALEMMEVQNGE